MQIPTSDIEIYLHTLADTPMILNHLASDFTPDVLTLAPRSGEWSPAEILAHLRACAEVWTPSILRMLDQDRPRLVEIHPRQHAKKQGYAKLDFKTNLEVFCQLRPPLIKRLVTLRGEDWQRSAWIKGREHTVFSHTRRMAKHEASHLLQIQEILNKLEEKP